MDSEEVFMLARVSFFLAASLFGLVSGTYEYFYPKAAVKK